MKTVVTLLLLWAFSMDARAQLSNESEVGVLLTSGNSDAQAYNLAQSSKFSLAPHGAFLKGNYLQQKSNGVLSARRWSVGARYEMQMSHKIGLFAGELVESDVFAKYDQRYHTDLGAKYVFSSGEDFHWFAEAGYRFTRENRVNGESLDYHYLRSYSELERFWSKRVSSKLWVEYLPNLTNGSDYQVNGEASTIAQLESIFSLKVAYLGRYDNLPAPGALKKTDSTFTTSLVAKF